MAQENKLSQNNHPCDVLVVGGGVAGISAAIAAARSGCEVVLLEKYGFLGGMATAGMVGTVCGLFLREINSTPHFVCGGFMQEFAKRLQKISFSKPVLMSNGLYVLPYEPRRFEFLADQLIGEDPLIKLVLHGVLTSLSVENTNVMEAKCLVWNKQIVFHPKCLVDCTGEATAIYLAEGTVKKSKIKQSPAVVFLMNNVEETINSENAQISLLRDIIRGINDGRLSSSCQNISFLPTEKKNSIYIKIQLPSEGNDDWNSMTQWELLGRKIVWELSEYLIKNTTFFKKARLQQRSMQVGIRIGQYAKGKYTLTHTDIMKCRKFDDGVACGAWPIEQWKDNCRQTMEFMPEGGFYQIPIGCLIAEDLDNMFVAGRCISATPRALASARVIGTSICTGWAAGTAAAFKAKKRPLELAVQKIRKEQVAGII